MKAAIIITDVDSYIACFPQEIQKLLKQLRTAIIKAAPQAQETISYQMPAYRFQGPLVYFAAYKNHIGFYPTASGIAAFKDQLSLYKNSKGAVHFPLKEPLPLQLITRIILFRLKENAVKAASNKSNKT